MTRLALSAFALALAALAQSPKPVGGGGSTPSPIGTTTPSTGTTRSTTTPIPTNDPNQGIGPTTFISGKVVLSDGTPPPEPVVLERFCGSMRRAETRTDLKGHFSFQIGGGAASNTEMLMDASNGAMSGARTAAGATGSSTTNGSRMNSQTNLQGCELRAVLPGYQSSTVNLTTHGSLDNPDVGIIILKRLAGRESDTISMTNALAPKDAKKAFDKSRQLIAKGNAPEAQKELSKAVDLYPKYASAWSELGRLQMESNDAAAAKQSFQKALEADPKYLPPYERLAVLALRDRAWPDLLATTDRLIQLNAYDYPQAYYYNALANLNLNHAEAAEKSARAALKQDPEKFSRATYVLGLAMAQQGSFGPAAEQLKSYLATNPSTTEVDTIRKQLADLERLATQQTAAAPKQ